MFTITIALILGTTLLVLYLWTNREKFSPVNSYDVQDTQISISTVTELKTSIPSTIPSTDTYTPFYTKFSLTTLLISILEKEFPDYNFAPEIKDLKISPDKSNFVFNVSGITKQSPKLLSLSVHLTLSNPLKYLNSDGDFFLPPNAQAGDFTLQGISLNKESTKITQSVLPNSPFYTPYSRITNNLFLLGPFEKNAK